jgi:hypothetical protein
VARLLGEFYGQILLAVGLFNFTEIYAFQDKPLDGESGAKESQLKTQCKAEKQGEMAQLHNWPFLK